MIYWDDMVLLHFYELQDVNLMYKPKTHKIKH